MKIDYACLKTAAVVGTGIHVYSVVLNSEHFNGIYQDITSGHWIRAILKTIVPFVLPYTVSYHGRQNARKEAQQRITALEQRLNDLESR